MAIAAAHAQIVKILKMEKEAHWLENKTLPPDEIQRTWALKSADLTAVLGVNAPTHPVDLTSSFQEYSPRQPGDVADLQKNACRRGRRSFVCLKEA